MELLEVCSQSKSETQKGSPLLLGLWCQEGRPPCLARARARSPRTGARHGPRVAPAPLRHVSGRGVLVSGRSLWPSVVPRVLSAARVFMQAILGSRLRNGKASRREWPGSQGRSWALMLPFLPRRARSSARVLTLRRRAQGNQPHARPGPQLIPAPKPGRPCPTGREEKSEPGTVRAEKLNRLQPCEEGNLLSWPGLSFQTFPPLTSCAGVGRGDLLRGAQRRSRWSREGITGPVPGRKEPWGGQTVPCPGRSLDCGLPWRRERRGPGPAPLAQPGVLVAPARGTVRGRVRAVHGSCEKAFSGKNTFSSPIPPGGLFSC